jgi:hypothetical protein
MHRRTLMASYGGARNARVRPQGVAQYGGAFLNSLFGIAA